MWENRGDNLAIVDDIPLLSQWIKNTKSEDLVFFGGDGGDRTHDLLNAIQALSQLSYTPEDLSQM